MPKSSKPVAYQTPLVAPQEAPNIGVPPEQPAGTVTLLRPDGSTIDATPEQASRLALLGYREQTPEERAAALGQQGTEEFYSSGDQRLTAGIEGVGAGLTFGASDYLLGGEDTKLRAAYNPGTRLAGETLGALAPLLISGGESGTFGPLTREADAVKSVASKLPPSVAAELADSIAIGKQGSLTRAVTRGIAEGGLYGGTQAADHAYLNNEPITAEAVFHGLGWGAVMGGVLSGIGHGISQVGEQELASLEKERARIQEMADGPAKREAERVLRLNEESAQRTSLRNAENRSKYEARLKEHTEEVATDKLNYETDTLISSLEHDSAVASAQAKYEKDLQAAVDSYVPRGSLKRTAGDAYDMLHAEVSDIGKVTREANLLADTALENSVARLEAATPNVPELAQIRKLYKRALSAAESGRVDLAETATAQYAAAVSEVGARAGVEMPSPEAALKKLVTMRAVAREISSLPRDIEAFASMTPGRAERAFALLDAAGKLEFEGAENLKAAVDQLKTALGVTPDTSMRAVWTNAKEILRREGAAVAEPTLTTPEPRSVKPPRERRPPVEPVEQKPFVYKTRPVKPGTPKAGTEEPGLLRKAVGYALGGKAYVAARVGGFGRAGAYAAYKATRDAITHGPADLLGIRAGTLTRVRAAAANYLPGAGRGVTRVAPRLSPLAISLVSGVISSDKDKRQLALDRVNEIRQLTAGGGDTLYRALEPLSVTQPDLAQSMHTAGMTALAALAASAPRDPGAVSMLKSLWKPSDVQAEVLARQLAVFHDPAGEAESMLASGQFDPIKIQTLRQVAPNMWQEMRLGVLERVTDPAIAAKMSYHDQIGISAMLDIPVHSSMAPEFIASSQQIFVNRNQPAPANPRIGQGGGLPNPRDKVGGDPNATQSQISTER